jgi:DNA polymerase III subunit gamma/tau
MRHSASRTIYFPPFQSTSSYMAKKAAANSESPAVSSAAAPFAVDENAVAANFVSASVGSGGDGKYTVVARRYRPKTFEELVGQSTVAQALISAIQSNRVGHAYLFTGARGVGKTSTARIFAKALNASAETNGKFDPCSDIALAIDSGEDMDVIEIDGASNRGIDEIRQLRANAAVRPSRSRYKIYIIDEVHMLTTQAFNALLKTLEEPPGHVKFIFCTTDPEKMPITVLSRCQRFDFPPVQTDQIFQRLQFICNNEGCKADDAALRLVARRASGSMRDSQSLLEQLLSFGGNEITTEVVHAMLGTADESRLASFAERLIGRNAAGALRELDTAANEGVDVGQLAEQLLGYLRDMMTMTVGGDADLIRTANPNSAAQLAEWGKAWGTMTLLSALQLLDETIVKMRHSVQSRVLLEVALVQICNLQDLQSLSELVRAFAAGQSAPAVRLASPRPMSAATTVPSTNVDPKKKVELASASIATSTIEAPTIEEPTIEASTIKAPIVSDAPITREAACPGVTSSVTEAIVTESPSLAVPEKQSVAPNSLQADDETKEPLSLFRMMAKTQGGFADQCAAMTVRVVTVSHTQWRICLSRDGVSFCDYFQSGDNARRLGLALKKHLGRDIQLQFVVTEEPSPISDQAVQETDIALPSTVSATVAESSGPSVPQARLIRAAMNNPLVKQFVDLFEGVVVRVDPSRTISLGPHSPVRESIAPSTLDSRASIAASTTAS